MVILKGKSVFGGIAAGKIRFFRRKERSVKRLHITDTEREVSRFEQARQEGIRQLEQLYDQAVRDVGEANAAIFEVHRLMMEDLDYRDSVVHMITSQQVNAEFAVAAAADNFVAIFSSMEDAYMQGRAADVKDISERLLDILTGAAEKADEDEEPVIIGADDLVPSETLQLDQDMVLGFATMYGSANSHTAILARTMNIPAVIGLGEAFSQDYDGHMAVIDGFEGLVYIDPDEKVLEKMKERQEEARRRRELLIRLKGQENITLDGRRIQVYANIGHISDLGAAIQNDAQGIGLFRSEFLYLESRDYPDEEQQFQAYRKVAEGMGGKKVIIRTLDIGADKTVPYFRLKPEENPAMGLRAIRICLTRPDIFRTQLRALYRASAFGNLSIMFPMIISVDEIRQIKEIIGQVKEELREEQVPFREDVELGIMIETPAAAVNSGILAQEVDFFSIGTNDLTQYTLAIDRQNASLEEFYDPYHPAVLKLIRTTVEQAHAHGIWCGICGELGGDLKMTELFLAMGVDELSVSPALILDLREKIRETDAGKAREKMLAKCRDLLYDGKE